MTWALQEREISREKLNVFLIAAQNNVAQSASLQKGKTPPPQRVSWI